MYRKIMLINLVIITMLFLGVNAYAQDLGASISDVDGRPGKQVIVNLTLSNNSTAAQAGFNITYNPKIADIEDITIDVSPGAALDGTNFFIVPAVKVRGGEEINTNSLFIGIFPGEIPTTFIPNGDIATIIFTIRDDASPGDFTDLDFSFMSFNATSFASQNGIPVSIDQSNFVNGLITVRQSDGGSGSCALAQGSIEANRVIDITLILLIPIVFVAVRRIWKKD